MACECHCSNSDIGKIIKVLNIISGAFMIALGILRFVYIAQLKHFLSFLLSIYYILFGIVIISTEFNWEFILTQFSFQKGHKGRGMFLIFMGILCFDSTSVTDTVGIIGLSCGIWVCLTGVVGCIYGFCSKKGEEINVERPVIINKNADAARI